jgi:hypothetical protein
MLKDRSPNTTVLLLLTAIGLVTALFEGSQVIARPKSSGTGYGTHRAKPK